jgi:antitoxin FitA
VSTGGTVFTSPKPPHAQRMLASATVPAIQVRDVPPDLHRRLRQRAAEERVTLSTYVLRLLERDVGRPSTREWLASLAIREPVPVVDVTGAVEGSRADRDSRARRVLRH